MVKGRKGKRKHISRGQKKIRQEGNHREEKEDGGEKEALEKGATHAKDNGRAAMDELLDVHGTRDIVGVASVMCVSFCSLCGLLL